MEIFFTLLVNLVPLYILIGIGFAAGRFFEVDRTTLANLAIYIFVPVVVFGFIARLDFQPSLLLLPVILYALHAAVGLSFLALGRRVYEGGGQANILSLLASMGNAGYFGLPLALLLFDTAQVAVYIFMLVGGIVYEATIAYYIAARGRFTVHESLLKLARFPSLYAVALGLAVNAAGLEMSAQFDTYWGYFKGAYVLSGMMIIGVSLSKVRRIEIGPRLLSLAFAGKFIVWPALVWGVIALDRAVLHLFSPEIYDLLFVISIVPPAANTAAFAAQMNLMPERTATVILLGTVFGLFYIPAMLMLAGVR